MGGTNSFNAVEHIVEISILSVHIDDEIQVEVGGASLC